VSRSNDSTPLPDAFTRSVLGLATLVVTTAMLNRRSVGAGEARVFRAVNRLPDRLFVPVWSVMQLGALGAAPAAAAVARATGRRRLATRLLLSGTVTWALSKVVKRAVGRPRPGALVPETRVRGREATGLGYLSGHAGVALALAVAAWPELPDPARLTSIVLVPTVGLARMYVGAHLPLDVAGGFALGVVVDAVVELALAGREDLR
jgi:undecaprenyl-diphosphatase